MKSFETDWLGFDKLFYNTRTQKVGKTIHELIESIDDLEIDEEGLSIYLDLGFVALGSTQFKNVKYVQYDEILEFDEQGKISIKKKKISEINHFDFDTETSVDFVHDVMNQELKSIIQKTHTNRVILPLSGGLDSRYLLSLLNEKTSVEAYSYGLTKNQRKAQEVVFAEYVASKLSVPWKFISIEKPYQFIPNWFSLMSSSTHLHGMYHYEFYRKIKGISTCKTIISGIIGDAWAGSVKIPEIDSSEKVLLLGYAHGMNADSNYLKSKKSTNQLIESYFEENRQVLKHPKRRVIESMRFKMMLLRYLLLVPEELGFITKTPFLNEKIAFSMLQLPEKQRENRAWQRDFFKKNGLEPELADLEFESYDANSFQYGYKKSDFSPIKSSLVTEILQKEIVNQTNRIIQKEFRKYQFLERLNKTRFHQFAKIWGYNHTLRSIFTDYLTLKPLDFVESSLK